MPSLTGAINATGALLYMFDPLEGVDGAWAVIAGQQTNDHTLTTALLDMSNKDSLGFQEFLEDEGRQDLSDSATLVFNTDATYVALQTAARDKGIRRFLWARGPLDTAPGADTFEGFVSSFVDNAANDAVLAATVTIVSGNDNKLFFNILFNDAIDVNADDAIDVNGDAAVARA